MLGVDWKVVGRAYGIYSVQSCSKEIGQIVKQSSEDILFCQHFVPMNPFQKTGIKLDRVGQVDNRSSTDQLHNFVQFV